ncbi:MAG TPA: alpha/beta hydrolase [Pyrinomonadaceae bacterium]|jgi:non-heme chloroperoxidase
MAYVKVGRENSADIELYYEDLGSGQPVVLIHGFPLSGHSWEKQTAALLGAGFRVVAYDRRGFGASDQPSSGYDYDTFAADLNELMTALDLRDAVLVGFSMGSGEVTRYLAKYGSERVSKAVSMGAIPPYLLKTDDNPEGVDASVFEEIKAAIVEDRPSYFTTFFENFFNTDKFGGLKIIGQKRITEEAVQMSFNVAVGASAIATLACVDAWLTDFREDVAKIDVPTLIIHGDADRILPLASTSERLPALIKNSRLVVIEDGPHAINWTHADEVNPVLLEFLQEKS